VNVSPEGAGTITSPQFNTPVQYPASFTCSVLYDLTAVPDADAGYEFYDWLVNGITATENPLAVSVAEGALSVTAFFRKANTPPAPPTADAGEDQTVFESKTVTLSGWNSSDPNADIRSYAWLQTAGVAVTLSDASLVNPTFTAPDVSLAESPITLTFELTVTDVLGASDTDSVNIFVQDSGNDPPTADAGDDQTVRELDPVTLDASGSFDPNNDIETYTWEQTAGDTVTLSDSAAVGPTFTAPPVETTEDPMTLTFKLTVEDSFEATSEDSVSIIVRRGPIGGDSSNAACFISGAGR